MASFFFFRNIGISFRNIGISFQNIGLRSSWLRIAQNPEHIFIQELSVIDEMEMDECSRWGERMSYGRFKKSLTNQRHSKSQSKSLSTDEGTGYCTIHLRQTRLRDRRECATYPRAGYQSLQLASYQLSWNCLQVCVYMFLCVCVYVCVCVCVCQSWIIILFISN